MKKEEQFLLWFEQLERKDVDIVGGKSSSLGEMTAKTDVPVPYGFATTAYAYSNFIKESGHEEKMRSILSELTDVENSALLRDVSARLRDAIMAEKMPQDLQDAIGAAYVELGKRVGEENPYVAVRSSATAEDLPDASFAGQQDTYLNVQGAETIIAKVKECYASCFTDRAVYYREKQGFDHIEVALSAVVQMMVFSKTSGVMFTVNVATGDDNNILIEAAFGLGEYVVQGTVTPDNYTISKHDHKIIDRCVNEQDIMLVRKKGGDCEEVQVPEELRKVQTLTDEQILELADYAKKIEKHYGCYMDMEWGVDERTNKIWILQARPETVWSRRNKEGGAKVQESKSMTTTDHKVIVKGLPASPGKVSGRVHVILDPSRIDEFKEGEILVTEMTAPDWVPAMKKAKAIVTDSGGMTCHASIVSRELGIPCIVGTKSRGEAATVTIPDGIDVTIDATHVIFAIGQTINWGNLLEGTKVTFQHGNYPVADKLTYQTNEPDIFVGGDVYTGPKFAIDAIEAGKCAAESLHRFVQPGTSLTIGRNRRDFIELNKDDLVIDGYDNQGRNEPGMDETIDYRNSFKDAHKTFTKEQAMSEANRCLCCGASIVDENKCIGCGVCTTKCEFDAIHLVRDHPEMSTMVKSEDKFKKILPYAIKRGLKIKFKTKTPEEKLSIKKHKEYVKAQKGNKK